MEPRQLHYWTPARRTRVCVSCDRREQVRTNAVGRDTSVCGRHWREFVNMLPQYDRDRLTQGRP